MYYELLIGSPAGNQGLPNSFQLPLWWKPKQIIVINQTSNPVFLNEGNLRVPTAAQYTTPFPAGSTPRLPTNSKEFAGFLPLTPALTDVNAIVKFIFTDEIG